MVGQIIEWPSSLLRVASHSYFLGANSRQGDRDLSGRVQIISTGDQIWSLQMTIALDDDPARIREFDAYVAMMEGMGNIAEFGVKDTLNYDHRVAPLQYPFSDGEYFSDDTGFIDGDATDVQPLIATEIAASGAKLVTVATSNPAITSLRVGDMFSHNYFLHRVTAWDAGDVSFLPALRTAVAVDDVLGTSPPVVRMRFASDGEGRATRTINNHRGALTLNFIEVFDR